MLNKHKRTLLTLLTLGLTSATANAESGDSAMAQALFDEAKQLLAGGHAAEACPKLEESQRLDPRSGTQINLASCYEQTGRLASAWSAYLEAASEAKAAGNSDRETVARQRAAALGPKLSKLMITVDPSLQQVKDLLVTRDGIAVREPQWGVALPADPGEHEVTASAPGRAPFQRKVSMTGEGTTTTVSVPALAEQATTTPTAQPAGSVAVLSEPGLESKHGLGTARTVALVAGGVGVLGVGLGTVFGLASKSKHDQAAGYCNGAACSDPRGVTDGNAAQKDGNISTAMMIVGGVGLAAGVTLWLTAPKSSADAPAAQVGLGFGTVQLKGAF